MRYGLAGSWIPVGRTGTRDAVDTAKKGRSWYGGSGHKEDVLAVKRLMARFATTTVLTTTVLAVSAASWWTPAGAWEIVPHRAIYTLDLESARVGSNVSDVSGQMLFQWEDSCDGWTIEQRYLLNFLYVQGDEAEISSVYATWETKDGLEFSFNLRSTTNGNIDELVRGVAGIDGEGEAGAVEFRLPEQAERVLPEGTVFPTAHSLLLLDRAEAGESLFTATLFDGTDAEGLTDVSAFIGDERTEVPDEQFGGILNGSSWPVRMAFFPLADETLEPEFELDIVLFESGIVGAMIIDYGDFSVRAVLSELEALSNQSC